MPTRQAQVNFEITLIYSLEKIQVLIQSKRHYAINSKYGEKINQLEAETEQ